MVNVMDLYPPVREASGRIWYRPNRDPGFDVSQWAWTCDPMMAHDDYMCVGCYGHPSRCDCVTGVLLPSDTGRDDPTSISNLMAAGPPRPLYEPHQFNGTPGILGGNCRDCGGPVVEPWHDGPRRTLP